MFCKKCELKASGLVLKNSYEILGEEQRVQEQPSFCLGEDLNKWRLPLNPKRWHKCAVIKLEPLQIFNISVSLQIF